MRQIDEINKKSAYSEVAEICGVDSSVFDQQLAKSMKKYKAPKIKLKDPTEQALLTEKANDFERNLAQNLANEIKAGLDARKTFDATLRGMTANCNEKVSKIAVAAKSYKKNPPAHGSKELAMTGVKLGLETAKAKLTAIENIRKTVGCDLVERNIAEHYQKKNNTFSLETSKQLFFDINTFGTEHYGDADSSGNRYSHKSDNEIANSLKNLLISAQKYMSYVDKFPDSAHYQIETVIEKLNTQVDKVQASQLSSGSTKDHSRAFSDLKNICANLNNHLEKGHKDEVKNTGSTETKPQQKAETPSIFDSLRANVQKAKMESANRSKVQEKPEPEADNSPPAFKK